MPVTIMSMSIMSVLCMRVVRTARAMRLVCCVCTSSFLFREICIERCTNSRRTRTIQHLLCCRRNARSLPLNPGRFEIGERFPLCIS